MGQMRIAIGIECHLDQLQGIMGASGAFVLASVSFGRIGHKTLI